MLLAEFIIRIHVYINHCLSLNLHLYCTSTSNVFHYSQDIPKPCNNKGRHESLLDILSSYIKASLICVCCWGQGYQCSDFACCIWCFELLTLLRPCSQNSVTLLQFFSCYRWLDSLIKFNLVNIFFWLESAIQIYVTQHRNAFVPS